MMKKIVSLLALGLLFTAQGNAASLSIQTPTDANTTESFQLQIFGDFSEDGFAGGGIDLFWDDTLVALDSVVRSFGDAAFSCPGNSGCPPTTASSTTIAWGDFSALIDADAAPTLMATLQFTALATTGLAEFSMQDKSDFAGGWLDAGFGFINTPDFGTASVNINVIPVPASVWLFGSALGLLAGVRRRLGTVRD